MQEVLPDHFQEIFVFVFVFGRTPQHAKLP